MRDFFAQVVGLDLATSREAIARSGLKYYGHLNLTPGEYLVRVLVRNAETGRTGVEAVRLSIPAFGQREPAVLPPFFLDPPGRWVLVRERTGDQQASVVYPFTVKGEPYIPAAKPALKAGESADLCLVAYHLDGGAVEVDGRVLASNGDEVTGGRLELRERTITGMDGLDKLLLRFDPSGLKAGAYRLEVAVARPGTETREVNSIDFSVLN
jgi:hypothetical protein